jgi:hypothetical protein
MITDPGSDRRRSDTGNLGESSVRTGSPSYTAHSLTPDGTAVGAIRSIDGIDHKCVEASDRQTVWVKADSRWADDPDAYSNYNPSWLNESS